jgi:hypothetical protein
MKNKLLYGLILMLSPVLAQAQDSKFKLGLRFAPGISMSRVQDLDETDQVTWAAGSSGVRFSAGLTGDFYFGRNYSFYTGVWYTVMKAGLEANFDSSGTKSAAASVINIQYLQVPLALKLFTNEIATDVKLYFVVGGTASLALKEIAISNKNENQKFQKAALGKGYSIGDFGLLLGAGAEYRLGENTTLFGGISYNRGLLNVPSVKGPLIWRNKEVDGLYDMNLSQLNLEMGIKF